MKRRESNDVTTVQGLYINDFTRGFFGEHNEGNEMLKVMGLLIDTLPFSAAHFLQKGKIQWKDAKGNPAYISFKYKQILEWGNREDLEMIARIESETIGDLCMRCIYKKLND